MRPVYLILSAALLLLLHACQKQNTNTPGTMAGYAAPAGAPTVYAGTPFNSLFRDLRYKPEIQCVNAGKLTTITFSRGTRLTFYPNSFKDGAGNLITTGQVCIELTEIYKTGDMIANRVTTMEGSNLLTSAGQVLIYASRNGEKVFANKYGIAFKQPAPSSQPMALYFGNSRNADSVVTWTQVGAPVPGTRDTTAPAPGDTTGGWGAGLWYMFDSCTDFTWINADKLYEYTGSRSAVKLVVPGTDVTNANTQAFLVIPSINACINFYYNNSTPLTFNVTNIPDGLNAIVVVISKRNNKYYYYQTASFTVGAGISIDAYTTEVTLPYIKAQLAAL
jgi:hypothetical protein